MNDILNMCENMMRSDKGKMLANGLVFIGKSFFGLAEPAEPSPGFRPYTPRVPPELYKETFWNKLQTNLSRINLLHVITMACRIRLMESQTHNLA